MSVASPAEYIKHHLVHWRWSPVGDLNSFWTFNVDTILISIVCGCFFLAVLRYCALNMRVKNPGRLQIFAESVIDMVDEQVLAITGTRCPRISSLALTIFMWVWAMNFMDMIPVDLLPVIANTFGIHYFRAVPTADINMTLALALGVLFMIMYEGIRAHSLKGFLWSWIAEPFPIFVFPANIGFRLVEEFSKPVSLAVRLFGNMFIGELFFFLIALTPLKLQLGLGWFWLGLHLFVITLQAFIFMILTIVYVGMARETH